MRKLLIYLFGLQLAFLGSLALGKLGWVLPGLREVTGILYLSLAPGLLLLILFRFPQLLRLETVVYSVGLSLVFQMLLGALANALYPYVGISRPLSEFSLLATVGAITLILLAVGYRHLKEAKEPVQLEFKQVALAALPPLLLVPLGVLGAALFTFENNNLVLLALFASVSLLPLLAVWDRLPEEAQPFVVWATSLSLLWATSLVATTLPVEGDVGNEYYWANWVMTNGFWEPQLAVATNTLLRNTMVLPFYSLFSGMDMISVIKIVHPLLYSLTPVIMYLAFRRMWTPKVAFLSSFLFMAFYTFYVVMSRNGRTAMSEFFLALFLLALVDKCLSPVRAKLLAILFSLSIIVSHYGTSHLVMVSLFLAALLSFALSPRLHTRLITAGIAMIYLTVNMSWYMYTGSSQIFDQAVKFAKEVGHSLVTLGGFGETYSMYTLTRSWAPSSSLTLYLLMLMGILVSVGVLGLVVELIRRRKTPLTSDQAAFSICMYALFMAQFVPLLGRQFSPALTSHIALTVIAPFFALGIIQVGRVLSDILGGYKTLLGEGNCLKAAAVFLVVFFLLNSGFVAEVFIKGSDYGPNVLISKARADQIDDPTFSHALARVFFYEGEALSARWLGQHRRPEQWIYMDRETDNLMSTYGGMTPWYLDPAFQIMGYRSEYIAVIFVKDSHILLRRLDYVKRLTITKTTPPVFRLTRLVYELDEGKSKVYDNGETALYLVTFGPPSVPPLLPGQY